jgi:c-di-GMP-binding flagellar brake protein YcgR
MMTTSSLEKIFKKIKEPSASLFVVQYNRGTLSKVPVLFKQIKMQHRQIELEISAIFLSQVENLLSGNQEVSIYIEKMECLFKAKFLSLDVDRRVLIISFPIDYVLNDRRHKERVLTGSSVVQFLYHHDQPYVITQKHIYDLSLGGCSLVFSASEYLRLKKEHYLKNFAISFQNKTHYFSGRVVGIRKLKKFELENLPYAQYRVAIAFDDFDDVQNIFLLSILDNLANLQKKKSS